MPTDEHDPFGEYAPEPETAGLPRVRERPVPDEHDPFGEYAPKPDEVETAKYGIGKPRRIIVRGTIAADKSPKDKRD